MSDISPLKNLTSLTYLSLGCNNINNVTPLCNLTDLENLRLNGNQISDITTLANLTNLKSLDLASNQISDIAPLKILDNLKSLSLQYNQVEDITPLVENEGLSIGDRIYLKNNPLNSESRDVLIPQLEQRGVQVFFKYEGHSVDIFRLVMETILIALLIYLLKRLWKRKKAPKNKIPYTSMT
jgi:Leucine-rich repeat (LRR) protein